MSTKIVIGFVWSCCKDLQNNTIHRLTPSKKDSWKKVAFKLNGQSGAKVLSAQQLVSYNEAIQTYNADRNHYVGAALAGLVVAGAVAGMSGNNNTANAGSAAVLGAAQSAQLRVSETPTIGDNTMALNISSPRKSQFHLSSINGASWLLR